LKFSYFQRVDVFSKEASGGVRFSVIRPAAGELCITPPSQGKGIILKEFGQSLIGEFTQSYSKAGITLKRRYSAAHRTMRCVAEATGRRGQTP
jgi:hypothetical protein